MNDRTLKDIAIDFLRLAANGQVREAYARHVGAGFRHHNPYFRGDAESLQQGMAANAAKNPNKVLQVHKALQDGDQVALFSHVKQQPSDRGAAVVHIFRFEGQRIVELWDVGQAVPEQSINDSGMF